MLINSIYRLQDIAQITGGKSIGLKDTFIKNICFDTRPYIEDNNHLFIGLKSKKNNGIKYVDQAYNKGIRLFLLNEKPKNIYSNSAYLIVDDTLKALQKWAAFHRNKFNITVLGITGSFGKTIIKEWVYHLIRKEFNIIRSPKSYNSQLGVALSLLAINKSHEIAIIEAGISLPGEMESLKKMINPTHSIISNIGTAHLKNFNDIEHLTKEKEEILHGTESTYFKNNNSREFKSEIYNEGQKITTKYLGLKSEFFLNARDEISANNFMCSLSFLEQLKIDKSVIQSECISLPEIALRMEKKAGINQSIIINDSYRGDMQSLKIGLEALKSECGNRETTVILADFEDKKISNSQYYNQIGELLNEYKISQFIGIGSNFKKHREIFQKHYLFYNNPNEFLANLKEINFHNNYILIKGSKDKIFQKIALKLEAKKHETILEIDLSNIEQNYLSYKNLIPVNSKVLAMIKAAGYGAGLVEIGKKLSKINLDYLGVAYSDEGVELRKNNIDMPILVMNVEEKSMEDVIEYQLTPAIYDLFQLDKFTNKLVTLGLKNYPVHVKINTGMNRMGIEISEINELISFLLSQPEIKIDGIFSHLAASDEKDGKELTNQQIRTFKKAAVLIEKQIGYKVTKHILNSSGIENYSAHSMDMVRLGIGLYGISNQLSLKNVATLKSKISKIRIIQANKQIGYGVKNITKSKMKLGIIPIGYADGFSRNFGNGKAKVFVNGNLVPTVGSVCMDMAFIDLTNINAKAGDGVEIFGLNNSIQKLAKSVNTIPYEILSSISQRVARIYSED